MKQLLRLVPVILAVVFVLADSKPARAATCFEDLKTCYVHAAFADTWVDMWLRGLDCELTFVDCTRRAIIGR